LLGLPDHSRGSQYAVLQVPTGGADVLIGSHGEEVLAIKASDGPFTTPNFLNLKDLYLRVATSTQLLNVILFVE
jgi:hypothetical protein